MPPKFAFGAATFRFQRADDCAEPSEHAPDAWVQLFVQCAGGDVLGSVFTCCKGGRDLVLEHASRATLTQDSTSPLPHQTRLLQLCGAVKLLSIRGSRPTTLAIRTSHVTGQDLTSSPFFHICSSLNSNPSITDIEFQPASQVTSANATIYTLLLQVVSVCFPSLTGLTLHAPLPLPPPDRSFKQLTQLHIIMSDNQEYRWSSRFAKEVDKSVSMFLPQLKSVTVTWPEGHPRISSSWDDILCVAATSHTLTHLTVPNEKLDDDLISLLVSHAPSLTHLTVSEFDCSLNEAHRDTQWAVQSLYMRVMKTSEMAKLPRPASDSVRVRTWEEWPVFLVTAEGLDEAVLSRLPDFVFDTPTLIFQASCSLDDSAHTAAFTAALQQLSQLRAAGQLAVQFSGFSWDGTMLRAAAAAPPAQLLYRLHLYTQLSEPLTDELLAVALQLGTQIYDLSVPSLALQSEQCVGSVCPWDTLGVHTLNVCELLRLPHPGGSGWPLEVCCSQIVIDDSVREVGVDRLTEWLSHVCFPSNTYRDHTELIISLCCPHIAHTATTTQQPTGAPQPAHTTQPTTTLQVTHTARTNTTPQPTPSAPAGSAACPYAESLSAQLRVLRALRLYNEESEEAVVVQLLGWPLTHVVMALLQDLPEWAACVDLCGVSWPLGEQEYTRLAQHIPHTYTTWRLSVWHQSRLFDCVCGGVEGRRQGVCEEPLVCVSPLQNVKERSVGKHVKVTSVMHAQDSRAPYG